MRGKTASLHSSRRNEILHGTLLLVPALAFYSVFLVYPLIQAIVLSFFQWDGFSPDRRFVGLGNYAHILTDRKIVAALLRNVAWAALSIAPILFGLLLAALLTRRKLPGRNLFRLIYFLPFILPLVIVGVAWKWIYQPDWGIINRALEWVGLSSVSFLGNPNLVLYSLVGVGSWTYFGFCMLVFFSGIQQIPPELYEAAVIDGATGFRRFVSITIPQLKNQFTLLVILTVIWSFKVFDLVYVMTDGGPYGSSEVLGYLTFVLAFEHRSIGLSTATAVAMSVLVIVVSAIYLGRQEDGE